MELGHGFVQVSSVSHKSDSPGMIVTSTFIFDSLENSSEAVENDSPTTGIYVENALVETDPCRSDSH